MRPYAGNPLQPDMSARLYVKRDWQSPAWRLAWSNPGSGSYCYDTGEANSAGRFRTRRDAIAYGLRRYGERAIWARDWA